MKCTHYSEGKKMKQFRQLLLPHLSALLLLKTGSEPVNQEHTGPAYKLFSSFPHSSVLSRSLSQDGACVKGTAQCPVILGEGHFIPPLCDPLCVRCSDVGMLGTWALCPGVY